MLLKKKMQTWHQLFANLSLLQKLRKKEQGVRNYSVNKIHFNLLKCVAVLAMRNLLLCQYWSILINFLIAFSLMICLCLFPFQFLSFHG